MCIRDSSKTVTPQSSTLILISTLFDFIPVAIYTNVQYYIILGIILVILLYAMTGELQNPTGRQSLNTFGWFFVVIFTLYMGLRQVHWVFGDTYNYNKAYQRLLEGQEIIITKDYLFNYMMVFSSKLMLSLIHI